MTRCIRFRDVAGALWVSLPLYAHASGTPGHTQTLYLMYCGGCHGIEGRSASSVVPDLRGQAGLFLCSGEGRDYMLRVPNVSMSLIRDDASLADVMNFVVFRFGGRLPADARAFTAPEVHEARLRPLRATDLAGLRRSILERAVAACAP